LFDYLALKAFQSEMMNYSENLMVGKAGLPPLPFGRGSF